MNLIHLQEFIAIVRYGSFSDAALELCITQSSLSKHMMALEKELGVELFDRSKRNVKMTLTGHVLYKYAHSINKEYISLLNEIKEHSQIEKTTIRIATIPVITQYKIVNLISKFKENHPNISIELLAETQKAKMLNELVDAKYDLVIIRDNFLNPDEYRIWPIAEDQLAFVTYSAHPLADRKTVSLNEIRNEKFILIDPETGLSEICLSACRKAGFTPKVLYTNDRVETIIGLIAAGEGSTLFMHKVMGYFNHPDISVIPISEGINSTTSLVKPIDQKMKPAEKLFVEYLSACCNKQLQRGLQ